MTTRSKMSRTMQGNSTKRPTRKLSTSSASSSLKCLSFLLLAGTASLMIGTASAIPLLGNRFETTTDVQDILNFALDAADMREAADVASKKTIYENGKNAGVSLSSLSLDASTTMALNPIYHFFRHAFFMIGSNNEGEPEGKFDGKPIEQYADTIVNDLFDLSVEGIETEAALVMTIWISVVNELFKAVNACNDGQKDSALASLDRAVAFWVGEGQIYGSNERGQMLYNLAEVAGERFGQDSFETKVNTDLMALFLELQTKFQDNTCGVGSEELLLRARLKKAIGLMSVPLVQMMIHHIVNVDNDGGSDFVELYSLSIIPRVAACDNKAYQDLLKLTVLRELTSAQQQSAITALQATYSCLGVTCEEVGEYLTGTVPQCVDATTTTLAGYTTTSAESPLKSYIDRDIKQIDIFLKFRAFSIALDWYQNGWNSVYTLQELSKNEVVPKITDGLVDEFDQYYSTATTNQWIVVAMQQLEDFANASLNQTREMVSGLLAHVVMYLSSIAHLQFAIQECEQSRATSAVDAWDTGVMFYVGSNVGDVITDDTHGLLMYSAARELCDDFNTCITSQGNGDVLDAHANTVVMTGFQDGVQKIQQNNCADAKVVLEGSIIPAMAIPLFQGTVKYASYNANLPAGTSDGSLAIGDTFARGILPMLNSVRTASAATVDANMKFQLSSKPVSGGFQAVTQALTLALVDLGTSCGEIGVFKDEPGTSDLCEGTPSSPVAVVPVTPSPMLYPTLAPVIAPNPPPTRAPYPAPVHVDAEDIAFGRYVFTNNDLAEGNANFALDVRDMFEAPGNTKAREIYTDGANSVTEGLSGNEGTISLQSLSTEAAIYMSQDPMFNIFKYALYEDKFLDDTDGSDFLFGDGIVLEALSNGKDHKLAAEGAVIMNVWMFIAHKLHKAVRLCRDGIDPSALIDSSVALWIGKEQREAEFDTGWMIYSIAQSAHKFYGHPTGESPINTELFTQFNKMLSLSRTCGSSQTAFVELRETALETIRNLSKPLILALLFHMVLSTKNMVELYSVAVVPQAAACNHATNSALQNVLFSGFHHSKINEELKNNIADFLRCQRVTCEDLRVTENADDKLANFVNSLCSRIDTTDGPDPIVGYQPSNSVTEYARLDMDTLQIRIFTLTKAYEAAQDVYRFGANSRQPEPSASGMNLMSLRTFATGSERDIVPSLSLFSQYFSSSNYADDIIMDGLSQTGKYAQATRWQVEEVVVRALQGMVCYMAVLTFLQDALNMCQDGDTDAALLSWDTAVALLVGSIEGTTPGQQKGGKGKQLYAVGNEMCTVFGTCEVSGESKSNEQLLFNLAEGSTSLKDKQCEHVERTLTWSILPNMQIPLIQGVLYYAEANPALGVKSGDMDIATGHILSASLEPLVKDVNATAAQILSRNFDFETNRPPVEDGAAVVYEAFTHVLYGMGIDCTDIGQSITSSSLQVCDHEVVVKHQDTSTNLGDDLYVTTTYVQDQANIAKDVSDMINALNSGNRDMATLIYEEGENSKIYDENGKFEKLRSLAGFSRDDTLLMFSDPVFNLFLYAGRGNRRRLNSEQARSYGHEFVKNALSTSSTGTLPAEAAVALNLWMYLTHLLFDMLQQCEEKRIRNEDGIHSIDEAVAYWIGDGQIAGDGERGHLLYALAEEMGDFFHMTDGGQSRTNTNILRLFNMAKNELSLPNACSESPSTVVRLRQIVHAINALMAVPLAQGLIHNLRLNDRDRVNLYGHAFVPLVAGCSPNSFAYLRDKLLGFDYNFVEVETVIAEIRKSLPCLGLTCADIGSHDSELIDGAPACEDQDDLASLAGYSPSHDVREFARFDLDIQQLDIFMQMEAYKPAEDIYTYGKHVRNHDQSGAAISLSHLATTSERSIVPQFDTFTQYYQDDNYADNIVRSAFSTDDDSMSVTRRRTIAVRSSQVLVMYFGALQSINEAVSLCSDGGPDRYSAAGEAWDKSAALLIGSLEGTAEGGSRNGFMYYDLSQEFCYQFATCSEDLTWNDANQEILSLLYTGRGAVLGKSCGGLRKAASELSTYILIPVIQGLLSASIRISDPKDPDPDLSIAEGFVFARAVLPLVDHVDRKAAETISKHLGPSGPQTKSAVAPEVFNAMARVYHGLDVDCLDIGTPTGYDPCEGLVVPKKISGATLGIILGAVALVCICLGGVAFIRLRQKGAKKLPENNPKFIASEGELNHSMDLLQKAFSSNGRQAGETDGLTKDFDASSPTEDDDTEIAPLKESSADII